ncbi:hypothetical protein BMETH_21711542267, partial [methanotrophic bacterial endosymbiont of Bathymodiolus sp.]
NKSNKYEFERNQSGQHPKHYLSFPETLVKKEQCFIERVKEMIAQGIESHA